MKKVIRITAMLVLITLAAANASAQSKMSDQQKQEFIAKFQELKQKLNLTDEQSKKVDSINDTWLQGIAAIRKSNGTRIARHQKLKTLNEQRNKQMKDVLTKEQFKIFKQEQEEMKEQFRQRRANRE